METTNWADAFEGADAIFVDGVQAIMRAELVEATHFADAVLVYAWDLGYQGRALGLGMYRAARLANIGDLRLEAEYEDGKAEKEGRPLRGNLRFEIEAHIEYLRDEYRMEGSIERVASDFLEEFEIKAEVCDVVEELKGFGIGVAEPLVSVPEPHARPETRDDIAAAIEVLNRAQFELDLDGGRGNYDATDKLLIEVEALITDARRMLYPEAAEAEPCAGCDAASPIGCLAKQCVRGL